MSRALCEVRDDLRRTVGRARWTGMFHLTLAFLGPQEPDRVEPALRSARRALAGRTDFYASFAHLGAFPSWERPRIIWAGLQEGARELADIAAALRAELATEGFRPEDRVFVPHATLGRLRAGGPVRQLASAAARWQDADIWKMTRFDVKELVLYKSVLSPQGAAHTALARLGLRP